jgi:hypothetical protein
VEITDVGSSGEAAARVKSHDADLDAEFLSDLRSVITEAEQTVTAGNTQFDDCEGPVAQTSRLDGSVVEAPCVVRTADRAGA